MNITEKKDKGFTKAALAGLAAKEDYTSVKLKNSDYVNHVGEFPPFSSLMLIQIKGRRYCQVRLIEPRIESLNNGDCFILVTPMRLFLILGETANIIEKSKANELFDWIQQRKDLGLHKTQAECSIIDCKSSLIFKSMPEKGQNENFLTQTEEELLRILAINSANSLDPERFQFSDKDETYEQLITSTNKVYRVVKKEEYESSDTTGSDDSNSENDTKVSKYSLEPLKDYWASLLSYNMLNEKHVFVFDFGSEFYIWNGRNASSCEKKAGVTLAKQFFNSGYDYSTSEISPVSGKLKVECYDDEYFVSKSRPKWTLFGKQTQNAETILFRGKFIDWPNQSSTPALKKLGYNGSLKKVETIEKSNVKPASQVISTSDTIFNFESLGDIETLNLVSPNSTPVNLVLELTNLGRGRHWFDQEENRRFDIVTENVQIWKILNNELIECERLTELIASYTYVIKWHYKVNAVGFRSLKGAASQHQGVRGRDRYALFFWQGENSSKAEKGSSALLSLDNLAASIGSNSEASENNQSVLTNEKHSIPHVQVNQHEEIATFCQLFNGELLILRDDNLSEDRWRMLELRGELEEESHLIEIKQCSIEGLRSRTSFIFINLMQNRAFIWHGRVLNDLHRSLIRKCASKLKNRYSNANITVTELFEESDDDWGTLSTNVFKTNEHVQFENFPESVFEHTPRLFLMTSLYGKFEVREVLNPLRSEKPCPYPFFQFSLYNQEQPSLFMIDNEHEIYLWQGWYESMSGENNMKQISSQQDATDGSLKLRYNKNRRCAMETAIKYWNHKHPGKDLKGYIVYAGLEPKEFTEIFPFWEICPNARNSNLNDGKVVDQKDDILDVLARLNRDRYPAEVLRGRPLPDGVNPLKLECYLSDEEFRELLQTSKEEFVNLPAWKQTNLKKKARLF